MRSPTKLYVWLADLIERIGAGQQEAARLKGVGPAVVARVDGFQRPAETVVSDAGAIACGIGDGDAIAGVTNTAALTTRYEYDATGNRISVTDSAGNITRVSFDALRRNTAVTDANQGITRFAFDARDNLRAVQDANGNQHRMEVDRLGRKTRETRPGGQAWQWSYDAAGNLAGQTDAKGQSTAHTHDAANRLIRTQIGSKTITYDYNAAGSLTAWNDGTASGTISLDALHRKTAETVNYATATATISHTYRYRYAAAGTKSALVLPDGTEVALTHDANRQLTQMQLPQGAIATTYGNAYTKIETLTPGGARSTTQLDALLRVASIDLKGPTQQTLLNYGYQFDAAGNITSSVATVAQSRRRFVRASGCACHVEAALPSPATNLICRERKAGLG